MFSEANDYESMYERGKMKLFRTQVAEREKRVVNFNKQNIRHIARTN